MRHIFIFFFLTSSLQLCPAQDCYQSFLQEGITAYNLLDFEKAINQFNAAKICDDLPAGNDVDVWISKSQSGYIDAIKKAQQEAENALAKANALYLANLSKQALQEGDLIVAFRLMEKAYQAHINPVTQEMIIAFQQKYDALFANVSEYLLLKRFNGNYISQTRDGRVHIHDGDSGAIMYTLHTSAGDEFVATLIFNPNGKQIATISTSGEVRLWGADGLPEFLLKENRRIANHIEFSKNGDYLLAHSENNVVHLYSTSLFQTLNKDILEGVIMATFSPDNRYVMGLATDGDCKIFDIKTDSLIVDENVGIGEILDASFSPNNQQVIFISAADKILLADISLSENSRQLIIPMIQKTPESIDRVIVSEDGRYVLVLLKGQSEYGAILYDQKGKIISNLKHADLEWKMVTINSEETMLVFRINNEVQLRKLEKHSFKDNILNQYNNKMRPLSQEEKRRFGIPE